MDTGILISAFRKDTISRHISKGTCKIPIICYNDIEGKLVPFSKLEEASRLPLTRLAWGAAATRG